MIIPELPLSALICRGTAFASYAAKEDGLHSPHFPLSMASFTPQFLDFNGDYLWTYYHWPFLSRYIYARRSRLTEPPSRVLPPPGRLIWSGAA